MTIYKITNTVNGKVYIGKTYKSLNRRWKEHLYKAATGRGLYLYKAIRKYGEGSFKIEVLDRADGPEELADKEIHYIALYKSNVPDKGYNLTSGGEGVAGYKHTAEAKIRMAENHGYSSGFREKLSRSTFTLWQTPEYRKRTTEAHRGKGHSKETRLKLAELGRKRQQSFETKAKIGAANKLQWTPERREAQAERMRVMRKLQLGSSNG